MVRLAPCCTTVLEACKILVRERVGRACGPRRGCSHCAFAGAAAHGGTSGGMGAGPERVTQCLLFMALSNGTGS